MFAAPWPVRAMFATLERVAPEIGARRAEKIWFTLPPRRHQPMTEHPGGTRFVATVGKLPGSAQRAGGADRRTPLHGHEIVGTAWGDGPAVYLVHGWAGHRGQFSGFVAPLLARGFRVVAFDMPSHGESAPGAFGPRSSTFVEFTDALNDVVARFGRPHAIVAHSGGSISAAAALADGMTAERIVMLAPMASPESYLRQFATVLGFGPRTYTRLARRVERRVGVPMRHFDIPELGRAVAMPKTLVIHDRHDRSTSVADGAAVAAAWPGARLHVTEGLGHNKILRDPGVIAEVVDFVSA
jgi:pimeloyl-ACP methyl ester carboxylesterase